MKKYIVDAWAWIEYFAGTEYGAKLNNILEDASSDVYTSAISLAEVISKTAKEKKDIEAAHDMILSNSIVVNIDEELSKYTGQLHAQMRLTRKDFGIADAFVLALARKLEAQVVTGDPHFEGLKAAILIK